MKTSRLKNASSSSHVVVYPVALRERRQSAGLSVEAAASAAGIEPEQWRRLEIENGAPKRLHPDLHGTIQEALRQAELINGSRSPRPDPEPPEPPVKALAERPLRGTCSATTGRGTPCRNYAVSGSGLCRQHQPGDGRKMPNNQRRCEATISRSSKRCSQPAIVGSSRCRHHQGEVAAQPEQETSGEQAPAASAGSWLQRMVERAFDLVESRDASIEGLVALIDALRRIDEEGAP
jgi:hypothetical protein